MARSVGTGRGGRGAALLEALRAQQSKPGAYTETPSTGIPVARGGRGRASLLALISQKAEETEPRSPSNVAWPALLTQQSAGSCDPPQTLKHQLVSQPGLAEKTDHHLPRSFRDMRLQKRTENAPVVRRGSSGEELKATANYVRLMVQPGKGVFEYEVRFDPELDSKSMRTKLLNQHLRDLGGTKTFDGVTLYLPIKLEQQATVFECMHPIDSTPVTMNILYKRQQRLGECVHLYNVLLRRIMVVLDLARIGRQHFNPKASHSIPQHKLEVWPGFVTAIDEYEGGIQLCCDSSHRVLRMQTVLEFIGECTQKHPQSFREEVHKVLIGASVLTKYNNKTYRVDDITWDKNPKSLFLTHTGEEISFETYYKKQYNLEIRDKEQPLLINRMRKKTRGQETIEQLICLVPELCYLTGLTDEMRADFRVMKDIASYTRITPNQRQAALHKFIASINENEHAQALLAEWGLKLAPTTVDLDARVVGNESIKFGGNVIHKTLPQADWSTIATRSPVLSAVDLERWLIVHTTRDIRFANEFATMMKKVGPQMGIQVCDPRTCPLPNDRTESYLRGLRENINPNLQVVVLICPTARDDRYSAIKKLCCAELPIASQVINSRTLSRSNRLRSVVQKIALQINCKLGGSLWSVKIPFDNCMVCGIDTYHCGKGHSRSVGGFVASLNPVLTRWYSQVCFQGPHQELVDGIKLCFISALKKYYEVNHMFPNKIVIYRDGVGDGQLKTAAEYEVPQLESCFRLINQSYCPTLTVIICQKRINTRIFASLNGALENPPPGTVVDHTVTRRDWYDFFLVSQHVRQGTVSPTHYVVIHDTSNMKTDHVQRLTYKLCHLYYNWPGTIRVPAPCQYAHKLAYLVGQNINRDPSTKLLDKLFFL